MPQITVSRWLPKKTTLLAASAAAGQKLSVERAGRLIAAAIISGIAETAVNSGQSPSP